MAVYAAIAILALLTATMLAIEVGRVYSAQRQLQKAATLAALDAARVVSGCSATATQANLDNAVTTSLAFNGYPSGALTSIVTEYGTVKTDANNLRLLQTNASLLASNAARVTLTAPLPSLLLPLLRNTGGHMRASATATQSALGSLRVGSGVASLSGGALNSLLSALLGGNVNLSLVDFNGLANVNVTATQLATAVGLSVTDLSDPLKLSTATPVLSTTLNNLAGALSGTASQQVIDSIKNLAGQSTNNTPIPLGSILGPVGNVASNVPFVNLQDLIMALALSTQADATGVKSVELKNIGLDIPNVASVKVFAKVLQPPQLSGLGRPGQTKASTAQITLLVRINGNGAVITSLTSTITATLNGLLGGLGALLGLPTPTVTLPNPLNIGLDVTVAPATAYLDRIDCPKSGVNNGEPVAGLSAKTGLATVALGTFSGSASAAPPLSTVVPWTIIDAALDASHVCVGLNILNLCLTYADLGKTDIKVNLNPTTVGVSQYGPVALHDVTLFTATTPATTPPSYLADRPVTYNPQTIASPTSASLTLGVGVTHSGSGLIDGVATLVSSLLSAVTTVLQSLLTLVNGLLAGLINPLLSALGIQLGTATTTMDLVTVGQPYIVTTALP